MSSQPLSLSEHGRRCSISHKKSCFIPLTFSSNNCSVSFLVIVLESLVGILCKVLPLTGFDDLKHTEQKQLNNPLALWISCNLSSFSSNILTFDGVASFLLSLLIRFSFDDFSVAIHGGGYGSLRGRTPGAC